MGMPIVTVTPVNGGKRKPATGNCKSGATGVLRQEKSTPFSKRYFFYEHLPTFPYRGRDRVLRVLFVTCSHLGFKYTEEMGVGV